MCIKGDVDMECIINGNKTETETGISVEKLLLERKLNPEVVVVELNREIVDRSLFSDTIIPDNAEIEILSFVGGGINE